MSDSGYECTIFLGLFGPDRQLALLVVNQPHGLDRVENEVHHDFVGFEPDQLADSEEFQPPIPIETSHLSRRKPAGDSDETSRGGGADHERLA